MSNPVFTNSNVFGEPRRDGRGAGAAPRPRFGAYGPQRQDPAGTAGSHSSPEAAAAQTVSVGYPVADAHSDVKRLTYNAVVAKTGGLLALLTIVAAATWQINPAIWPVGMVVGLVLGLVNAFKREPMPALIVLYTLAQGVFLGGISYAFTNQVVADGQPLSGIVVQAILATIVTFGATLALYRSGKVRVTPKFTRFLIVFLTGFVALQLINLLLVATGVFTNAGVRSGGLGIIVGVVAVGLATMSLLVDFDSIKRGVEGGADAKYAWSAAFGLMVTLIWLYLEFLRLLAILNRNS